MTPAQLALAWVLPQRPWIVPVPGTAMSSRAIQHMQFLRCKAGSISHARTAIRERRPRSDLTGGHQPRCLTCAATHARKQVLAPRGDFQLCSDLANCRDDASCVEATEMRLRNRTPRQGGQGRLIPAVAGTSPLMIHEGVGTLQTADHGAVRKRFGLLPSPVTSWWRGTSMM